MMNLANRSRTNEDKIGSVKGHKKSITEHECQTFGFHCRAHAGVLALSFFMVSPPLTCHSYQPVISPPISVVMVDFSLRCYQVSSSILCLNVKCDFPTLFDLDYPKEEALGMESGNITDDAITSNSNYTLLNNAYFGRLNWNRGNGGWCSSSSGPPPYLEINFGTKMNVTAVATQGVQDKVRGSLMVDSYELEFQSTLNGTWQKVLNAITGRPQVMS